MAKLYYAYDELSKVAGYLKPLGTLGAHHMMVGRVGNGIQVEGSVGGSVHLMPGQTLGYDRGSVWLVPSPDQYKCPLRRLLATKRVAQRVLTRSNEAVTAAYWYGREVSGSCADTKEGDELVALQANIQNSFEGDTYYHQVGEGEGLAIIDRRIMSSGAFTTCDRRPRKINTVVVRPNLTADQFKQVLEWLDKEIT